MGMMPGDEYLAKAAAFSARAECESNPKTRAEFERLSHAYLFLAGQAKRISAIDVTNEPPAPKPIVQSEGR
jgi:hypothetical protein